MTKNSNFNEERSKEWGLEGARQLLSGKIRCSNLFFSVIDPKYFEELLRTLTQSQVPLSKENTPLALYPDKFRWFCHCYASYYGIPNVFESFSLIRRCFISSDSDLIYEIRGYLRDPEVKTDINLKINLAEKFFELIENYRPFSIWLLPILKTIYEPISTSQLYQKFHFNMFNLFTDISHFSESDISEIDYEYNDERPYQQLFQIPQIYSDSQIPNIIQKKLFKKYHFPIPTSFGGSGLFISLVNTTFSTDEHFIDIFQKHLVTLFEKGDFQNFMKFSGYFRYFQAWFFASVFRDKCPTLPYYFKKPEFKYESIATDFLNRLFNDRKLFQTVREMTGTTNSCIEFLNHSIPYLFLNSIRINILILSEPIRSLQSIQFFIISDEDRDADFDFCYCYFVMYKIMENIVNSVGKDEAMLHTEIVVQCEDFIRLITSNEKRKSLFIDLLSLIFIQDEEGQFICPFNIGFLIIKVLLEVNEDESIMQFIKSAHQRFNLVLSLGMIQNIESAIRPNKYQLLDSLLANDEDVAKYLSNLSESNEQLYKLSKSVNEYEESKESFNINQSNESTIKEIALSFNDQTALRYSLNFETSDVEHAAFDKRLKDKYVLFVFPEYPEIIQQFSNFDTNKWDVQEVKEKLPLFGSFYNRLNSFIPISLHINFAETVRDVLLLNPTNMIIELLKSKNFEKSEEIAQKLNTDIYSIVFSGDFSEDVYLHFAKETPSVAYTSIISNNHYLTPRKQKFVNKNITKILYEGKNEKENLKIRSNRNRLLSSKQKVKIDSNVTFSNANEKVDLYYNIEQKGAKEDVLYECIDELFNIWPKQKELMLDIRYHLDENDFQKRILKKIDNENIKKIRDLFDECIIDTERYDFLLSLNMKVFPLEACFRELTNKGEYEKARKLYDYFQDMSDFSEIINEMEKDIIQHHKNIDPILTYFPFIKQRILSSFPFQQVSEFDTDFQHFLGLIPEDWDTNCQPSEIVANHINEYGIVHDLLQEFSFLNIDESIIKLIKENIVENETFVQIVKIVQLVESVDLFIEDIRDVDKFIKFIMKNISRILSTLKTSLDNEQIYKATLLRKSIISLRNNEYISREYESFINKMDCLYQILHRQLFSKFNLQISFENFETRERGNEFAELSLKYDDIDLLQSVCESWNLSFNSFFDRRIIYPYQLSVYDVDDIEDCTELTDKEQIETREKLSEDIINILSHSLFYDPVLIQNLNEISLPIENLLDFLKYSMREKSQKQMKNRSKTGFMKNQNKSKRTTTFKFSKKNAHLNQSSADTKTESEFKLGIYHRIKNIIKTQNVSTKDQMRQLEYFLDHGSSRMKTISYYVSSCKLTQAVQFLNEIDDESEKEELFSACLFEEAINYDVVGRLRNSMKITPDYAKPHLESLLDKANENDLLNLKLMITQLLNLHDASAETAIELYKGQNGNYQNLAYLDIAQIEISLELRIRKQGVKKEECILSTEKLNDLMKRIDLQRKYNMFLCERQLQNCNFSTFGNLENQELIVLLLFKEKYFELAFEFVYEFQIPMNVVGEKIIDILISQDGQELVNYISILERNSSPNIFREIVYSMINRVIYVFHKLNIAGLIIKKAISDSLFVCGLMIQFDMIDDAAELAFKNNFYDFIPVIANQAYLSMKKELSQKCLKYLENNQNQ